jgi:hypothetical protein
MKCMHFGCWEAAAQAAWAIACGTAERAHHLACVRGIRAPFQSHSLKAAGTLAVCCAVLRLGLRCLAPCVWQ